VADHARRCHSQQPLGIFGTSIAGAWLFGELGGAVRFFVDEDPARVGGTYMGLPIYHPLAVPAGSHVFIGLAPGVAEQVAFRFRGNGAFTFTTHLPSGMPRESIGVESP
jgi:hypothetical protein